MNRAERGPALWRPHHVGVMCLAVGASDFVQVWMSAIAIVLVCVSYTACQWSDCLRGGARCMSIWMRAIGFVCMHRMSSLGPICQCAMCVGVWAMDNLVCGTHGRVMDAPDSLCLSGCVRVHHVCSGHGCEWIWSVIARGDVTHDSVSCLFVDVWLKWIMSDSGSYESSYTYTYEESDSAREETSQASMDETETKPEEEPDFGDDTDPLDNGPNGRPQIVDGAAHEGQPQTVEDAVTPDVAVEEVTRALDSAHLVQTEPAVSSKAELPPDGELSTCEAVAQATPLLSKEDDVATSVVPEAEPLKAGQVDTQDHAPTHSRVRMFLVMELAELLHRRKIETVDNIAEAVTQANMVTQQAKAQLALALQCNEANKVWQELWTARWLGSVKKGQRLDRLARECGADEVSLQAHVSAFDDAIAAMITAGDLIAPTWNVVSDCLSNKKKRPGWNCVLQAAGLIMGMSDARAARPCADAGRDESWGPKWSSQGVEQAADDPSATQWDDYGWNWKSHNSQSWRQWNETPSGSAATVDQRYEATQEVADVAMGDKTNEDNDIEDESSSRRSVSLRPWKPNSVTWTKFGLLEYLAEKHTWKRDRPPWVEEEVEPPWKCSRTKTGPELCVQEPPPPAVTLQMVPVHSMHPPPPPKPVATQPLASCSQSAGIPPPPPPVRALGVGSSNKMPPAPPLSVQRAGVYCSVPTPPSNKWRCA
eukprot:1485157-Amphidinium_carterae.1